MNNKARENHKRRFLNTILPLNKRTVISTDGQLTMLRSASDGKKPNWTKRKRTARTTTTTNKQQQKTLGHHISPHIQMKNSQQQYSCYHISTIFLTPPPPCQIFIVLQLTNIGLYILCHHQTSRLNHHLEEQAYRLTSA